MGGGRGGISRDVGQVNNPALIPLAPGTANGRAGIDRRWCHVYDPAADVSVPGGDMSAPLSNVRVLEVTNFVATPSAGVVLADFGADVVKIEPLRGDTWRGLTRPPKATAGMASLDYGFQLDNRGKRSVAIALDQPEGAELVRRLVARRRCVPVQPAPPPPGALRPRAGLLAAVNPRLVHATFTGYGMTGPDRKRPGCDNVTAFFGRGAVIDAMIEPGQRRPDAPPAQGDHTAGLALVASILATLRLAERTGEGQAVDASLLGTAAWTMATDLSAVLIDGRELTKRDRHHLISPLANRFRVRRRSLDRAGHAGGALVASVLPGVRASGLGDRSPLRHDEEPLRQHARTDRAGRRRVRHPSGATSGAASSTRPA